MPPDCEVLITGLGVVSPIGLGRKAFWQSLVAGQSGVGSVSRFDVSQALAQVAAEIPDFDPKAHIRPLKSLKVMCRDIQLGVAAANLAIADSGLDLASLDTERRGVLMGSAMLYCEPVEVEAAYRSCLDARGFHFDRWGSRAQSELYPLWMLRYLPNMAACHVGIAHDCRGPNNSVVLGDVSGLMAVGEAADVIQRGAADVMLAGGTCSLVHPTLWIRNHVLTMSRRRDEPSRASRPFDRDRDGWVPGEAAAILVLERGEHARARHAHAYARWAGLSRTFQPPQAPPGLALRQALVSACAALDEAPHALGHVKAHGLSTPDDDAIEAQALAAVLGDVPVTAPKSMLGNSAAAAGAVELVAAVLAIDQQCVPPTANYDTPDPRCPIRVVHGEPLLHRQPTALAISLARTGQVAVASLGPA